MENNKNSESPENQNKESKPINRERILIIAVIVALVISVTAYGLTVPNFTDYSPPDVLVIRWGDYFTNSTLSQHQTTSNNTTNWKYWTADYPYRAMFFGGKPASSSEQNHDTYLWIVYSKKPTTDIFTYEYIESKGSRSGYIRAQYSKDIDPDEIRVTYHTWSGVQAGSVEVNGFSTVTFPGSASSIYSIGNNYYFDFDFFYKCAGQHQTNVSNLGVSGVTSISGVPYAYILNCDNHGGTAESGSTNGGGTSSGGGSSSGAKLPSNSKGDKGRPAWGDGEHGGDIDWSQVPSISDGGEYSSTDGWGTPDYEYSSPSDWQKPHIPSSNSGKYDWEDDENIPELDWQFPDKPYDVQGWGDTGQNGSSIDWPTLTTPDNNFSFTIPSAPWDGKTKPIEIPYNWTIVDSWPPALH